jgi:methylated-DNA-[protein]-cysteine S-methyltransferase
MSRKQSELESREIRYTRVPSPLGAMYVAFTAQGLLSLSLTARTDAEFLKELRAGGLRAGPRAVRDDSTRARWTEILGAWFRGERVEVALDLRGCSAFERRVLGVVRRIPRGKTRTYAQVAEQAGHPGAARAVGRVMAKNPIPLFVPCHRVVRSDGGLGGYSGGGPHMKRRLLALEGAKGFD